MTTTPRVRNIAFDASENPTEVTIVMDVRHAAEIARRFGELSTATGGNTFTTEIYDCLTGALFNRFFEDGVAEYFRDHA